VEGGELWKTTLPPVGDTDHPDVEQLSYLRNRYFIDAIIRIFGVFLDFSTED